MVVGSFRERLGANNLYPSLLQSMDSGHENQFRLETEQDIMFDRMVALVIILFY